MLVILWSDTTYEFVKSSKKSLAKTEKQSRVLEIMLLLCSYIHFFGWGGGGGSSYFSSICVHNLYIQVRAFCKDRGKKMFLKVGWSNFSQNSWFLSKACFTCFTPLMDMRTSKVKTC